MDAHRRSRGWNGSGVLRLQREWGVSPSKCAGTPELNWQGTSSGRGTVPEPQRSASPRPLSGTPVVGPSYWLVPVLRAVPAVIVGLIITFMEDHSPRVGLIAFGVMALVSGLVLLVGALRTVVDRVVRGVLVGQGVVSVVTGGAAIALWASSIAVLLFIVTVYAAL